MMVGDLYFQSRSVNLKTYKVISILMDKEPSDAQVSCNASQNKWPPVHRYTPYVICGDVSQPYFSLDRIIIFGVTFL